MRRPLWLFMVAASEGLRRAVRKGGGGGVAPMEQGRTLNKILILLFHFNTKNNKRDFVYGVRDICIRLNDCPLPMRDIT